MVNLMSKQDFSASAVPMPLQLDVSFSSIPIVVVFVVFLIFSLLDIWFAFPPHLGVRPLLVFRS